MSQTLEDITQQLGLNLDTPDEPAPSTYWVDLDGDSFAAAIVERFDRQRSWLEANGLLQGWKLKLCYYHSEFRANPDVPHLNLMTQFGESGQFTFLAVNHLRALLKVLLGSIIQNPPSYQTKSSNADASAMESAALYQGLLDYYVRDLRINSKIASAVERAIVVDNGYILVEWDQFASDGDATPGLWKGAPSVKVLNPWDLAFDITANSFDDLNWIIIRDFVDREKVKAQFPELTDDIEGARSRAQVTQSNTSQEPNRYDLNSYPEMSNDIQVFKMYHRKTAFMPDGRFAMALENGKLLFDSPIGNPYEKLPVERMVCDEQTDMPTLGYSPINELIGIQEAVNTIQGAITSNANNYSNQFIAMQQGTQLNPRTLQTGQTVLEYSPGSPVPVGLNLTQIPNTLFEHVKSLEQFMQTISAVSQSSRGQTGGANQTGSAMLFLASQSSTNNGSMQQNYSNFSAAIMTAILNLLKVFGRTERTIEIIGKSVASRTIVMADVLKDFDEVVVDQTNPIMATAQGKMALAQQLLQYGGCTPEQVLQVISSGNLGPAADPAREAQFELDLENEWLLQGDSVLVNSLDDHENHIKMHTRLLATPWLRKPDLAQKLNIQNAPAIMQNVMGHIMQHMQALGSNQVSSTQTSAGQQPGQPEQAPSAALGHMPQASPDVPQNNPAQAVPASGGPAMPAPPSMPH